MGASSVPELEPQAAPAPLDEQGPAPPPTPSDIGRRALQGVIITALFAVVLEGVKAVAGLYTARLLQPRDFAIAGAASVALMVGSQALNFSIGSRLVQVAEDPQDAYDYGFTLQVWLSVVYVVFAILAGPVLARLYGDSILIPICVVLSLQGLAMPGLVPLVLLQRELAWWRLRAVTSVGPMAGVTATLALALTGFGVWSLIIGQLISTVGGAIVLFLATSRRPRLRLRVPRDSVRFFFSFGWPLWAAGLVGVISANGLTFEIKLALGLAALGYFRVAISLGDRINTAENVLSSVIYPVVCRIRDVAQMRSAFDVSARLLLMWAVPAGLGLAVFAEDIVHFILGEQWAAIVPLLRMEGLAEVANAIATLWSVFYVASGQTRPMLHMGVQVNLLLLALTGIAAAAFGIPGVALVVGLAAVFSLLQRRRFIRQLFPGIPVLRSAAPLVAAGVIAAAAAVWLKFMLPGTGVRTLLVRLACFLVVYSALVLAAERPLIGQAIALVRNRPS